MSRGQWAAYVLLSFGAAVTVLPFAWMVLGAFRPDYEITQFPPTWLPSRFTMENMTRVWQQVDFGGYLFNSLVATVSITAITVFTSAFVGYVFGKFHFRFQNALFIGVLAAMMIPWPITLLPRYQIIVQAGLLDSLGALVVPAVYNAFGIFMMRQFMHSIPNELIHAARVDGASESRIFLRIILPLAKPALAALAILEFTWNWDAFIWPFLALNSEEKFTLPVGLASFNGEFVTDFGALMAGGTIGVVPMLIVYLMFQRYFIAGIALTGTKG